MWGRGSAPDPERAALTSAEDEDEEDNAYSQEISPVMKSKIEDRQKKIQRLHLKKSLLTGKFDQPELMELDRQISDYIVVQSLAFLIVTCFMVAIFSVIGEFF